MTQILLIDNYDSFTYNLKHCVAVIDGVEVVVCKNDDDIVALIKKHQISGVIIGPGPGSPQEQEYFCNNSQAIDYCQHNKIPLLGVCLGYQGIFYHYGGHISVCDTVFHGKVSDIDIIAKCPIFYGLPKRMSVMRYHSLQIVVDTMPDTFELVAHIAKTPNTAVEAMAIQHKTLPIFGIQFHPESFISSGGQTIIDNFVKVCQGRLH